MRGLPSLDLIGGPAEGQVVVVTGPTSGIGRETAAALASRGARGERQAGGLAYTRHQLAAGASCSRSWRQLNVASSVNNAGKEGCSTLCQPAPRAVAAVP